jgi:hypothetical protein
MEKWAFLCGTDLERQLKLREPLRLEFVEADPYDRLQTRRRCGARAIIDLKRKGCQWIAPDTIDGQGNARFRLTLAHNLNPECEGVARTFQWFPNEIQSNGILVNVASTVAQSLPIALEPTLRVDMQIICYCPTALTGAFPTPNFIHQDDVAWTSITLLEKENIKGGHFWVCSPSAIGREIDTLTPAEVLFDTDFDHVLDTVVMHDRLVAHYVTPMCRTNINAPARRSILIVDYIIDAPNG